MRLENFLALTHGKLVSEPCVNIFINTVFNAHKVKRGDLFIAYDLTDIGIAVENGAYGIVFNGSVDILDAEIAWIEVENLDNAVRRLLRFRMIEKEIVVYECNEIILKLALQIITQPDFIALKGDLQTVFRSLWNIPDRTTVLFCPDINSRDIFTEIKTLPKIHTNSIDIMEQTLFETSFIYENTFYERQLISPFFIPYLEELLHLLKSLKINFRLRKFTPIEHFEAVFTNNSFEIKNFGTSDKVLIFEPNASLIESEIMFLQERASWADIIFILPSYITCMDNSKIFSYDDEKKIIGILRENNFHFALVVGVDRSILNSSLPYQTQLTLDL